MLRKINSSMIPEEDLDELLQNVLNYIEEESQYWDERLVEKSLIEIIQLILETSCEKIFVDLYQCFDMECYPIYPKLSLSEDTLCDQSKFFCLDCIYYFVKQSLPDNKEELNFYEFYDIFVDFIKHIQKINAKGMQNELRQLVKLLKNVCFVADEEAEESLRYVPSGKRDTDIDVLKQTQRFWLKWIVEKSTKDISRSALLSKNMKKQELFFWLLFAAIYNFANYFGDDELKKLRDCILYTHNINEKDITPVLKWCFECFDAIKFSNKDYQIINEIDYLQGLQGMFSLMERFHYVHFTVKKKMKEEMEECWKQPGKGFASQLAYDAWWKIEIDSIDTPNKIVGSWVKENKKLRMSGKEFLQRDIKEIWKDINIGYLNFEKPKFNQENFDSDEEKKEWLLGLDLFEEIWCNNNFERIKENYLNEYYNDSMTEEELASAFKPIWELSWELFEKIWVCKDTQNDIERVTVEELKSTCGQNWIDTWNTYKLFWKEKDIKKLKTECQNDNLSEDEFSDKLATKVEEDVIFTRSAFNHQMNLFTAYIIKTLIENISSKDWKYGLLSVKHIIFAKLYILMSELSDEDIKKWIEQDFQSMDSEIEVIDLVIYCLLNGYSMIYNEVHENLMCNWKDIVVRILNSQKIKVSKHLISYLSKSNNLEFKIDENGYISWNMPITTDYLYKLFIDNYYMSQIILYIH